MSTELEILSPADEEHNVAPSSNITLRINYTREDSINVQVQEDGEDDAPVPAIVNGAFQAGFTGTITDLGGDDFNVTINPAVDFNRGRQVWVSVQADEPYPNPFGVYFPKVDDGILFGDLDVLDGEAATTFAFWIRLDAWVAFGECIQRGNNGQFVIDTTTNETGNRLRFQIKNSSSAFKSIRSPAIFTDDTWFHIVMVVNGDTFTYYIDGVDVSGSCLSTGTFDTWQVTAGSQPWHFGARPASGDGCPGLWLDEVAVWPGFAASPAQVAEIYNGGDATDLNALSFAGPELYYRFSEDFVNAGTLGAAGDGAAEGAPDFVGPGPG